MAVSYEKLPEGVLRFEIRCERDYIREFEKKSGCTATEDVLWQLIQKSESRIMKHFSWCFSDVHFVQMDKAERLIRNSTFKRENKDSMLELVTQLQRVQSVDEALKRLERAGCNTAGLLDRFDRLGISPIPLRKNFCAKELPGLVELLRAVSSKEITLEYIEIKYK